MVNRSIAEILQKKRDEADAGIIKRWNSLAGYRIRFDEKI